MQINTHVFFLIILRKYYLCTENKKGCHLDILIIKSYIKSYRCNFSSYCLIFLGIFLFLYSLHSTPLCFKLFIDRYFRVVWAAMRGVEGR